MTVKPFKIDDLGAFLPNEFSNPDEIFPLMVNGMEVHTMWGDDGLVQAFLCVRNYWGNCWAGFILVSKNFIPENVFFLRDVIETEMRVRKAHRLETTSVSHPKLRVWHDVLGFTLEGTKRKFMLNKDYDIWAIVKEEA